MAASSDLSVHGFVAAISALFGGLGVRLLDRFFGRQEASRKARRKAAEGETDVQLELHRELARIREETRMELDAVRKELDNWKEKYFQLLEEHQALVAEHLYLQSKAKEWESRILTLEKRRKEES